MLLGLSGDTIMVDVDAIKGMSDDFLMQQAVMGATVSQGFSTVRAAASGGYYIATVAWDIQANRAGIVDSIGIRLDAFGAVDAAQGMGIEPETTKHCWIHSSQAMGSPRYV